MKSFSETLTEDRRLVILRLLKEAPSYSLNDRMLREGLKQVGHVVSLDVVKADIEWLREVGAVAKEEVVEGVTYAQLLRRGQEHVEMAAVIPGIKRPSAE